MNKTQLTDTDSLFIHKKMFCIGVECLAYAFMFHYFKRFSFTFSVYMDLNPFSFLSHCLAADFILITHLFIYCFRVLEVIQFICKYNPLLVLVNKQVVNGFKYEFKGKWHSAI